VGVHSNHGILDRCLRALLGRVTIDLLKGKELLLIEGGEVLAFGGAQIASRSLDPKNLGWLTGERILLGDLGGGVTAARVGHALVGTEQVGAVDELGNGIELGSYRVVPEVGQWGVCHVVRLQEECGMGGTVVCGWVFCFVWVIVGLKLF
jgi:hypothetical protein